MLSNKKRLGTLVITLALAACGAYYYASGRQAEAQQPAAATTSTAQVVRGDLSITADGTGTLIPGSEVDLAFTNGGELIQLLVDVGDEVSAGDVLAKVDDADAQATVTSAQLQLLKAQLDLATAETNLLTVQAGPSNADLALAKANLATAQAAYEDLVNGPDATTIEKLQLSLAQAKNNLYADQLARAAAGGQGEAQHEAARMALANAEISVRKAEIDLAAAQEPASETELLEAKAQVAQAQETLEELKASSSDENIATAKAQVEEAQLSLTQAELNLKAAQEALQQTTLVAPMDGTVMAVNAQVGDTVGSSSLLTLADLDHPQLRFYVEEADLSSVVPGNAINIVFDALPDLTFQGVVVSIDPTLTSVGNTSAVEVLASVDLSASPTQLLSGMNADVEVVAGEAHNALLVPVQALRKIGTDQYAVMIVQADGEMELRSVQVGLQSPVYAEILSGVEVGETVSTGTSTSVTQSGSTNSTMPSGPSGMPPMLGG
jgi:RND family efflux transporter MFP subunit